MYYVGSLWYENCDPFIGVVATSRKVAEEKLEFLVQEEISNILDSTPEDELIGDMEIYTSGVFEEPGADILKNGLFLRQEQLDDLLREGYVVF